MYPHERSLVQRLEGKPFALIGVNSDHDREKLKDVMQTERITWRSFWNGGDTDGPISNEWRVRGWPTLVLIDAKGVIRQRWEGSPGGPAIERAIDELLREMGP
jgi:hypothetical protein